MAKYNILIDTDANPDDELGITKATADYNAFQQPPAGFGLPAVPNLTNEEFLIKVISDLVASYTAEYFRSKGVELGSKYKKAPDLIRQDVETALIGIAASPTRIKKK